MSDAIESVIVNVMDESDRMGYGVRANRAGQSIVGFVANGRAFATVTWIGGDAYVIAWSYDGRDDWRAEVVNVVADESWAMYMFATVNAAMEMAVM